MLQLIYSKLSKTCVLVIFVTMKIYLDCKVCCEPEILQICV